MKVTIGVPAYNEEEKLPLILKQLEKIADSIIVCDDGSTDKTSDIARKFNTKLITHKKNLGYGSAIKSIFEKAVEIDTDVLVTFDAESEFEIENDQLLRLDLQ